MIRSILLDAGQSKRLKGENKLVRKFKNRKIKKMKTNLKFLKNFKEFFVDNSFIVIVISLIILILCFRYKEVRNKRKKTNI